MGIACSPTTSKIVSFNNLIVSLIDTYLKLVISLLNKQKIDAENRNNDSLVLRLDDDILKKQQYLQEYHKIMSDRIASKKENLLTSSGFSKEIIETIKFIAENEGFSIILRKKDPNILYYNYEVDITEKVIERLILRASAGN